MARRRQPYHNHLSTIEYIGPRPQKPQKRPNFLGGWVVLLIAAGAAWAGFKTLMPMVMAHQSAPSVEAADLIISEFQPSADFGQRLAAAALQRTKTTVSYDPAYYKIPYPGGDLPPGKGKAEDIVIRSYRSLGIDLQQLVHEDMKAHFSSYPQLWQAQGPDANIDHRRAANLQRFFERHGETLPCTRNPGDYLPGDMITWTRPGASGGSSIEVHIGIVVPGPGARSSEPWVVHHLDSNVKWEDVLFDFQILGHYRYDGGLKEIAAR